MRSKRIKRTDGGEPYLYHQLVRGYRDEHGKVKQEVLAHLGHHETPEAAIAAWERQARLRRWSVPGFQQGAENARTDRFSERRPPEHYEALVAEHIAEAERFEAKAHDLRSKLP